MAKNKRYLIYYERRRLYVIGTLLPILLYYVAVRVLEHFTITDPGGKFFAGVVIVLVLNFLVFLLYDSRLWVIEVKKEEGTITEKRRVNVTWDVLLGSDILAFMATLLFSACYIALNENARVRVFSIFDDEMSLLSGRLVRDIINLSQNVPVLNLGLAAIVGLTFLSSVIMTAYLACLNSMRNKKNVRR